MNSTSPLNVLLAFADKLRFRNLFLLTLCLLLLDLLVPDMLPMLDEIILGLIAIILANLKKDNAESGEPQGRTIEGEIIDTNDDHHDTGGKLP